ncbi:MAG: UDP-N-acetylmuramoyl-tripeptide--D-alanyl-D-alanine ligase [Bdellovibrionales bacterium]
MSGKFLWQAEEIVRAVRGRCLQEQSWGVSGISIDSRMVTSGDLFIALKEEARDEQASVAAAFAAGASAAIVSRQPMQVPPAAPLVFVDDTFAALHDLGRQGRARAQGKIIAVTGSVGKTSTKEMLRLALGAVGAVYAVSGNFNNSWGLPLALANLPEDTDYGIFEMGLTHAGELAALSLLARPDIAVITSIEAVHLECFASLEGLADAKAEVFLGMTENGIVLLNRDNLQYARLANAAKKRGIRKIASFSTNEKADAVVRECFPSGEGSAVKAVIAGRKISYSIGEPGMHLVKNSLAALLASFAASGKIDECAAALSHYRLLEGSGSLKTIDLFDGGQIKLIDEGDNASPASLRAALGVLAETKLNKKGRGILVLGDMLGLGETAPDLHIGLAPDIVTAGVSLVFCCGDMMRYLYDALPDALRGAYALDSEELAPLVARVVRADDVVTVKGSEGMKMKRIVEELEAFNALSDSEQKTSLKTANM